MQTFQSDIKDPPPTRSPSSQELSSFLSKTSESSSFSPFLSNTLQGHSDFGFCYGSVCFSQKHNMLIACPLNSTIQFYDATTLSPFEGRETRKLQGSVLNMSFHPETDTYIMGCAEGSIYMYNASTDELKRLKKREKQVLIVTFLNDKYYVFSCLESKKLLLGTLENENTMGFNSHNSDAFCLQHIPERNLLISGLMDGSVMIYRTDKPPCLKAVCSVRAHLEGMLVFTAQRIMINRKEYVITAGQECAVKIWHLIKGRMRLLRVIWTEEIPYSVVYLEKYKMIVIASECNYVKFVRLPFGKLESTVYLAKDDTHSLFLMKERNMVGVMSYNDSSIEFIQLEGTQGGENIQKIEESN